MPGNESNVGAFFDLDGTLLTVNSGKLWMSSERRAGRLDRKHMVTAAVFFAAYTVPLKLAQREGVDSYNMIAIMGVGTLLGGLTLFLAFSRERRKWFRYPVKDHLFAMLAGAIWGLATIAMTQAISHIGLSITWPVTNLNTIVTVGAGIFVFKEVDARKHASTIAVALACAVVGSALLGFAKI